MTTRQPQPYGTRWRTPIVSFLLLLGIALYIAAAATIGGRLPDSQFVILPFYLVAGIAWIFPAARLIGWARRDPQSEVDAAVRSPAP